MDTGSLMDEFTEDAVDMSELLYSLNELVRLNDENIFPKKYFLPVHYMKAYENIPLRAEGLKNTEYLADNIICLPIFSHMSKDTLERICYAIYRMYSSTSRG